MEIQQLDILFRLIIAHLFADFILQTDKIVAGKQKGLKAKHFHIHILIVGVVTYLFLGQWSNWWAPLLIMLVHGLIDLLKISFKKDNAWVYLADQFLHLFTLVIFWTLLTQNRLSDILHSAAYLLISDKILIIITAYLAVSIPIGIFIGYLTSNWQKQIVDISTETSDDSLNRAGRWIGILERILVLTFILLGELRAIGFLLAAKSVFRFGDLTGNQDRKKTEYILIGTLLSFTSSIILGILVQYFLLKI